MNISKQKDKMTTQEYHKLTQKLSQSAIKLFDDSRIKFYKRFILGDKTIETKSNSMILGDLVDCELLCKSEWDSRFAVANVSLPGGQLNEFTQELIKLTIASLDDNNTVIREITDLMEEAFKNVKYDYNGIEIAFKKKDFNWLTTNFIGTVFEEFYKESRVNFGKLVVDLNMIGQAEKVGESLKTCKFTRDIINLESSNYMEVINQLPIEFKLLETDCKALLDKAWINHNSHEIQPYDLKISYSGDNFNYSYWKNKYYLQAAMYNEALKYWIDNERTDLKNYTIKPLIFIVGDSTLQSKPLLWVTNDQNLQEGQLGFTLSSGRKAKGLYELIEDIKWHLDQNMWDMSKEAFKNDGKMSILPFELIEKQD